MEEKKLNKIKRHLADGNALEDVTERLSVSSRNARRFS